MVSFVVFGGTFLALVYPLQNEIHELNLDLKTVEEERISVEKQRDILIEANNKLEQDLSTARSDLQKSRIDLDDERATSKELRGLLQQTETVIESNDQQRQQVLNDTDELIEKMQQMESVTLAEKQNLEKSVKTLSEALSHNELQEKNCSVALAKLTKESGEEKLAIEEQKDLVTELRQTNSALLQQIQKMKDEKELLIKDLSEAEAKISKQDD